MHPNHRPRYPSQNRHSSQNFINDYPPPFSPYNSSPSTQQFHGPPHHVDGPAPPFPNHNFRGSAPPFPNQGPHNFRGSAPPFPNQGPHNFRGSAPPYSNQGSPYVGGPGPPFPNQGPHNFRGSTPPCSNQCPPYVGRPGPPFPNQRAHNIRGSAPIYPNRHPRPRFLISGSSHEPRRGPERFRGPRSRQHSRNRSRPSQYFSGADPPPQNCTGPTYDGLPLPQQAANSSRCSSSNDTDGRSTPNLLGPSSAGSRVKDMNRNGKIETVDERGFGFISVINETGRTVYDCNIFAHRSDLIDTSLVVGACVTFDVEPGRKGHRYQATNVRKRDESDKRGEVIDYDVLNSCGTIRCFDNGMKVLAREEDLNPPLEYISLGQILKFDVKYDLNGSSYAVNIDVVAEAEKQDFDSDGSRSLLSSENNSNLSDIPVPAEIPAITSEKSDLSAFVENELECSICFENVSENDVMTPCEHYFCDNCIKLHLKNKHECPNCRQYVVVSDLLPLPRVVKNMIDKTRKMKLTDSTS